MKSTARMLAGYKATRTRRLNQLRQRAWDKLREVCVGEAHFIPSILPLPEGGVELGYDLGDGIRFKKFSTREEALDYVVSLFSC